MRQINHKTDLKMQKQTTIIRGNNNGQFNHYRFTEELDRYKKR